MPAVEGFGFGQGTENKLEAENVTETLMNDFTNLNKLSLRLGSVNIVGVSSLFCLHSFNLPRSSLSL